MTCDDFWRLDPIEKPAQMSGRNRSRLRGKNRGRTMSRNRGRSTDRRTGGASTDAGTEEETKLELDRAHPTGPSPDCLHHELLLFFGIFLVFLPLFPHLSASSSPLFNHLTSTVSLMKQKFRFYIFTKNCKAPQV